MIRPRSKPFAWAAKLACVGLLLTLVPFSSCGGRPNSCPGFDSCKASTECPIVHCDCDNGYQIFAAQCQADGTCFTVSDCVERCESRSGVCAKPPPTCKAYIANECECSSTVTRFSESWNCVTGQQVAFNAQNCVEACGMAPVPTSGSAGGAGGGLGLGGSAPILDGSSSSFF